MTNISSSRKPEQPEEVSTFKISKFSGQDFQALKKAAEPLINLSITDLSFNFYSVVSARAYDCELTVSTGSILRAVGIDITKDETLDPPTFRTQVKDGLSIKDIQQVSNNDQIIISLNNSKNQTVRTITAKHAIVI